MEERCSVDASHGLLSLLSYITQGHLPRGGTAPSELGLNILMMLLLIMSQQNCLQSNVTEAYSLCCGSSSQSILACPVVPFPQQGFPKERLVGNNERGTF